MTTTHDPSSNPGAQPISPVAQPIRDQRTTPRGVLPRQLQMWLMVGLAVLILGIILITGRTAPAPRATLAGKANAPSALAPDRIQAYQRQLAEDAARLQHELAQQAVPLRAGTPTTTSGPRDMPTDPLADERRRRDYQSLFADNVAFTRRSGDVTTPAPPDAMAQRAPVANAAPALSLPTPATATPAAGTDRKERLVEGTVIETVLINRLDGTFTGPVTCLVTTSVYSQDRQRVVIPAGARVLGSAAPVQSWGDSRLAVSFHRIVMPDGRTFTLDQFKGLDQLGGTGLRDQVNRHYLQVFGASAAIGALSGLAQFGTTTGGYGPTSFEDQYRQAAGASLAASTGRVLDRYLNVLPTLTIREGFRIKVFLTSDVELPVFDADGDKQ